MTGVSTPTRPPGFGAALRIREFRALWAVDAVSMAGDQFARVALSVLVYRQTQSAFATGGVYALTFVPTFVGGVLLSGSADRRSRKQVMVVTDLVRAGLLATMAVPGVPLWGLCALLVVAVLLGAPFRAAQGALVADVLTSEPLYAAGAALRSATLQVGQLVGYGVGGLTVALVDPHVGLLIDAATFALSAAVVALEVRPRPAAAPIAPGTRWWGDLRAGLEVLTGHPQLRLAVGMVLLAGFYIAAEGLAAPYAAALGGGATATGLLLAAEPAGSALGAWLFVRLVPEVHRDRLVGVLAVVSGLAFAACALRPGLVGSWLLWALAGVFTAYQVQAAVVLVRHIPAGRRGQVMGLLAAALLTCQGLGVLAFGAVAELTGVVDAVALAGAAGAVVGALLSWRWARTLRAGASSVVVPT